jgi:alkanesulfonate monooxygenase SsuD/methylene tetrahydromethanopterin reductase-like flavin-dependent oxidoreductase (luciferase family)
MFKAFGLPTIKTAEMEDFAQVMRRLFKGEVIVGHSGPMGSYPVLALDPTFDEDIPLGITAFGHNTLELAGRAFDSVILHTFFTDETTARCVETVKQAAVRAGRDPATVRVWSCFATIGDHIPEDVRLKKTVGRLATYLQAYGGALDGTATTEQLEHVATLIPAEWRAPAATGSPSQCVDKIRGQFDLGVDGVILHGASPDDLAPIVDSYRSTRPSGRFDHLRANPGG